MNIASKESPPIRDEYIFWSNQEDDSEWAIACDIHFTFSKTICNKKTGLRTFVIKNL